MNWQSALSQVFNALPSLVAAIPAILGWFVIISLAWGIKKNWKQPITSQDAAYIMVALAAFAYAVR